MSKTKGKAVTIRGKKLHLRWYRRKLEEHYQAHPAGARDPRERDCWSDLFHVPRTITQAEYEDCSYVTVKKHRLHFRGRKLRHAAGDVFVDKRLVQVMTPDHRRVEADLIIRTCHHYHKGAEYHHEHGRHRDVPLEQLLREYKSDIDHDEAWHVAELPHWYKGVDDEALDSTSTD